MMTDKQIRKMYDAMEVMIREGIARYDAEGIPLAEFRWGASSPEMAAEMMRRIPGLPDPIHVG